MTRYIIILSCLAALAMGCNRNKTPVANADDANAAADQTDNTGAEKTEVAQGEIKELLLALRRVHFALDSDELVQQARDALDEAAQKLSSQQGITLYVDGHTDERGTTEHNMALGNRRAQVVVEYLTRLGVPKDMLIIMSHGEELPISEGQGNLAYAKNRRVEFRLKKGDIRFVLEEGAIFDDKGNPLDDAPAATDEAPGDEAE